MADENEQYEEIDYGTIDTNTRINKWVNLYLISNVEENYRMMEKCCTNLYLDLHSSMTKDEIEKQEEFKKQVRDLLQEHAATYSNWVQSKQSLPSETPVYTINPKVLDTLHNWFLAHKQLMKKLKIDFNVKENIGVQ